MKERGGSIDSKIACEPAARGYLICSLYLYGVQLRLCGPGDRLPLLWRGSLAPDLSMRPCETTAQALRRRVERTKWSTASVAVRQTGAYVLSIDITTSRPEANGFGRQNRLQLARGGLHCHHQGLAKSISVRLGHASLLRFAAFCCFCRASAALTTRHAGMRLLCKLCRADNLSGGRRTPANT
jgi:hypothetical protein